MNDALSSLRIEWRTQLVLSWALVGDRQFVPGIGGIALFQTKAAATRHKFQLASRGYQARVVRVRMTIEEE